MKDNNLFPSGEDLIGEENMYTTFFQETGRGKYVPRAIYVDLEPTVVGEWSKNFMKESSLLTTPFQGYIE